MNKTNISWQEIHNLIEKLSNHIRLIGHKYNYLYGIPRGGLIPAVMLSHELEIPISTTLKEGCLIVDEICDTGNELNQFQYKDFDTCVLFRRYKSIKLPTYYGQEIHSDDWLVFPWENKNI